MNHKIHHYKIPYEVKGSGNSIELTLKDDQKKLNHEEIVNDAEENIIKLSTKIAGDNAKEKELALAVGGKGFVIIKVLVE